MIDHEQKIFIQGEARFTSSDPVSRSFGRVALIAHTVATTVKQ